MLGIAQMQAGNQLGDIGARGPGACRGNGYGVVRQLVGHGIGTKMHEEPQVPNYGTPGRHAAAARAWSWPSSR